MTLFIPASLSPGVHEMEFFRVFMQGIANRRMVGALRYGPVKAKAKYFTWLKKEMRAYEKTGNMEHLINMANLCYLEAYAPNHPKFHWNAAADSVLRGKK